MVSLESYIDILKTAILNYLEIEPMYIQQKVLLLEKNTDTHTIQEMTKIVLKQRDLRIKFEKHLARYKMQRATFPTQDLTNTYQTVLNEWNGLLHFVEQHLKKSKKTQEKQMRAFQFLSVTQPAYQKTLRSMRMNFTHEWRMTRTLKKERGLLENEESDFYTLLYVFQEQLRLLRYKLTLFNKLLVAEKIKNKAWSLGGALTIFPDFGIHITDIISAPVYMVSSTGEISLRCSQTYAQFDKFRSEHSIFKQKTIGQKCIDYFKRNKPLIETK